MHVSRVSDVRSRAYLPSCRKDRLGTFVDARFSREPFHLKRLETGKRREQFITKEKRIHVEGPLTTNDPELMQVLAVAGVGLLFTFEPMIAEELRRGSLRIILEPYAAAVPGFFLYFP